MAKKRETSKSKKKDARDTATESRQKQRCYFILLCQRDNEFQCQSLQAIDFDRATFRVNNLVLFDCKFAIELSFDHAITLFIFRARRNYLNDNIRRSRYPLRRSDFVASFIAYENYVRYHAVVFIEDHTGRGYDLANWVLAKIEFEFCKQVS